MQIYKGFLTTQELLNAKLKNGHCLHKIKVYPCFKIIQKVYKIYAYLKKHSISFLKLKDIQKSYLIVM